MAGLLSLPAEIICEIFEHLQPLYEATSARISDVSWDLPSYYRTLAGLTRTCRYLNPMATQALYKRYYAMYTNPYPGFMRRICTDLSAGENVRHINILHNSPFCTYSGRSKDEVKAHLLNIPVLDRPEVEMLLNRDPAQVELAVLISQASNLETMSMTVYYLSSEPHPHRVPLWMRPLVEAGRKLPLLNNPKEKTMYGQLHTLELTVHEICSYDLAYLLCLPSLRRLQLDGLSYHAIESMDGNDLNWPIPVASSGLHTLRLGDIDAPAEVIKRFISSCKALTEFVCHCAYESEVYTCTRAWCAEILSALEQHSASLTLLSLDPEDQFTTDHRNHHFERLEGFNRFSSLKVLNVPWMLLMGRPPAHSVIKGTYRNYPHMRHLLPPNLEGLKLQMSPQTAPGVNEETLLSCLPQITESPDMEISLEAVSIDYYSISWLNPLPFSFWDIKDKFLDYGVEFHYDISGGMEYGSEYSCCYYIHQT